MFSKSIQKYNSVMSRLKLFNRNLTSLTVAWTSFLPTYYRLSDLMWQDGLLIDFLQKKVTDKWIRRFLVTSSYLFSERILFTFVVRFYVDYVVWPSTLFTTFECSSVATMLSATVLSISTLLLLFNFGYLAVLVF